MAKGINIDNGSPRSLSLDGVEVAAGGTANNAGLYTAGDSLYLDGAEIAEASGNVGLQVVDGSLQFNGSEVGSGDTPVVQSGLWIPPTQAASTYNAYTYDTLIAAYDDLKDNSAYPGTITKHTYSETSYGDYPLYSYIFAPPSYSKTFYVQACIHGNEKDAPQTIFRIFDIICNHASESGYSRLAQLRDDVRFVVIPVVSPWGFDHGSMNVPYTAWDETTQSMNMNRNADINHQYSIPQAGTGGNYPWQRPEVRHIKSVIESIGVENIDYLVDNHDGSDNYQHFWLNYNADGANAPMVRQLLADLIAYEDKLIEAGGTDYRSNGEWVIDYCRDASGYASGSFSAWFNSTLGALGSVCEYIGGYFGYGTSTFPAEQMTRSLRIRANLLIYAYEMLATKGWQVGEAEDATYFEFNYPIAMTRQGLRLDGADNNTSHTITSVTQVDERWNTLAETYPDYVVKSASLGQNYSGRDVYSYTLGSGSKKVLFIGGSMRWDAHHRETEFGIYVLAQYLCNDYIVAQSSFLTKLKNDYTIVVIPCIDFYAGNNDSGDAGRARSLNATAGSYTKWRIGSNSKCVPTTFGSNCADVGIFMQWIADNSDALALISGGEDTSGYLYEYKDKANSTKYRTDYMTQVIMPMNLTQPQWLTDYCTWLTDSRGEDAPVIEQTAGTTSADYAYDNYGIPTYYINLKPSNMWAEREQYMQDGDSSAKYLYRNYETGRRIADIANFFLMAGGNIE